LAKGIEERTMNISTLAALGVAGTIALLSVSQPVAESASPLRAQTKVRAHPQQVELVAPAPQPRQRSGPARRATRAEHESNVAHQQ
jgi:hypothetical protein